MEYDIHTLLDLLTLAATGWVIFMILTKLKSSWQRDKDALLEVYIVRSSRFSTHAWAHITPASLCLLPGTPACSTAAALYLA
jgi:hypothetical protein